MKIIVNGEPREVDEGATVADLVAAFGPQRAGDRVAVAVNGEVVRRGGWDTTTVTDDDRVELLAAMQGGTGKPARPAPERSRWTTR